MRITPMYGLGIQIGTRVKIVVPSGPNAGEVTGYGVCVGRRYSNLDGNVILVMRDGSDKVEEHSDTWIKDATTSK